MKQSPLAIGVSLLVGVLLGIGATRLLEDAPQARTVAPASTPPPQAAPAKPSPTVELEHPRAPVESAPVQEQPDAPRAPERTVERPTARPEAVAPGGPVFSAALEAY